MMHPLARFRIDRGLTQTELARFLGLSRSYLCRVEDGTRNISPRRLPQVVKRTGLTPEVLRPDLAKVMHVR